MLLIEFARRKKGLSQQQLGDAVRVHQTFISEIERGHALPVLDQRRKIARLLDVDPDTLTCPITEVVLGASEG